MSSLLEQLQDIEGLDSISWWPLAIGWWILIFIAFVVISAIVIILFYRRAFKRSWKNDTLKKLGLLEKSLSEKTARETIISLSEYLRRIVLKRFSRTECAGLVGKEWLQWLSKNDANQFDWEKKGGLLIDVPYAPAKNNIPTLQIKELIEAVRGWVR